MVFHTGNTDGRLFGDPQIFLHDESEARNFNISALGGRNRRLIPAVM